MFEIPQPPTDPRDHARPSVFDARRQAVVEILRANGGEPGDVCMLSWGSKAYPFSATHTKAIDQWNGEVRDIYTVRLGEVVHERISPGNGSSFRPVNTAALHLAIEGYLALQSLVFGGTRLKTVEWRYSRTQCTVLSLPYFGDYEPVGGDFGSTPSRPPATELDITASNEVIDFGNETAVFDYSFTWRGRRALVKCFTVAVTDAFTREIYRQTAFDGIFFEPEPKPPRKSVPRGEETVEDTLRLINERAVRVPDASGELHANLALTLARRKPRSNDLDHRFVVERIGALEYHTLGTLEGRDIHDSRPWTERRR